MFGDSVSGDTKDDRTGAFEFRHVFSECDRLFGTPGGIVLGIKIKDDMFVGEVLQRNFVACIGR
jgi:hypothetical protein